MSDRTPAGPQVWPAGPANRTAGPSSRDDDLQNQPAGQSGRDGDAFLWDIDLPNRDPGLRDWDSGLRDWDSGLQDWTVAGSFGPAQDALAAQDAFAAPAAAAAQTVSAANPPSAARAPSAVQPPSGARPPSYAQPPSGVQSDPVSISQRDLRRLLAAADPDAALVWLYLRAGAPPDGAAEALRLPAHRVDRAMALLRQMGLAPEPQPHVLAQDLRPQYTEHDVKTALQDPSGGFSLLIGETQRRLGRVLSTEELKILLSMTNYLGLPAEVVGILVTYCIERARARGGSRMPSLRTIEKEAYAWADRGIDTLELAAAYMTAGLDRQSRAGRVRSILQIENRRLTAGEEKYILSWLDMGFGEDELALAYEKTCMNTGSLKWPYMNSILTSWHNQGLLTVDQIRAGDSRPEKKKATAASQIGQIGDYEREAIARMHRNKPKKET